MLYKYVTACDALKYWLGESEMCFTSMSRLNDPFEAGAQLTDYSLLEALANRLFIARQLAKSLGRFPTHQEVKDYICKEMAMPVETWDAFGAVLAWRGLQHSFHQVGVLSLSKSADVVLMWSHYSSMSGVVLGFDSDCKEIRRSKYASFEGYNEVTYQTDRPSLEGDSVVEKIRSMCLTKSTDWAYEEEVRCFRKVKHSKPNEVIKFRPDALKRVIVGIGMELDIASRVFEMTTEYFPNVRLEIAVPDPERFSMIIVPAPPEAGEFLRFFDRKFVSDTAIVKTLDSF